VSFGIDSLNAGQAHPAGGGSGLDFELNIAPVIDCLTVLIAFTLVSASFVSIKVLEAGVGSFSEQAASTTDPRHDTAMSVRMSSSGSWILKLAGRASETVTVPPWADGRRDFEGLDAAIQKAREKFPDLREASVTADPAIEYREVVQAVELVRKELPKVYIGN
jgi:biopolymer transport protein ExbD